MYRNNIPKVYVESPFFPQPNQPNLKVWRIFFYRGKNVLIQVNECRFAPDLTHIYSPDFTPNIRYRDYRVDALIESENLLPMTSHITEQGLK